MQGYMQTAAVLPWTWAACTAMHSNEESTQTSTNFVECISTINDSVTDTHVVPDRYQHYLESVLEVAEDYQEIQDLLRRHATLQATNDHLRKHQQQSAAEAEEIRVQLQVSVQAPGCCSHWQPAATCVSNSCPSNSNSSAVPVRVVNGIAVCQA